MTIKKLTVAAAIAVGIATCSFNCANAACPCDDKPMVSESPCPCAEELPVVTGGACPCDSTPAPRCNSCNKPMSDCDCQPKSHCDDDCDACPDMSCDKPANPACAVCPGSAKPLSSDMKQVYAYPNAVYGGNNYIGELANSQYLMQDALRGAAPTLSSNINGVTVATDGQITGAAAQLPCLNESPAQHNGVMINRDEKKMDNNSCPIDISTENSIQAIKKTFVPFEFEDITGAAADIAMNGSAFPDVPSGYWAACDIDKLALNDVVVGYPDRLFKPGRQISRAEFATMIVKGFNLDTCGLSKEKIFKDVSLNSWANALIAKAVNENLMKGYPNGTFKPHNPVTRAEALCTIAKGINTDIDQCKADEILSKYSDGNTVPDWAKIPVAKALQAGALKDMPNCNTIAPYKDASRAEVASMLQTVRVSLGYDKNPTTANNCCPVRPEGTKAYVEQEEIVKIPTLKLTMLDQITAKSSHIGQSFRAETLEDVAINGTTFPCGSTVMGKVVEVIRPSGCNKGALKLAFTEIRNGDCKATLPKQILTAQINQSHQPNAIARAFEMPFTWTGSLIGIVGRTTGGMLTNLGNAGENVTNSLGYTLGNSLQGEFGAAGRSLGDAFVQTAKAPVDLTRTAVSGTMGLFQSTGDEFAYLVDPRGYKISAINPKEHVTIAFGCSE